MAKLAKYPLAGGLPSPFPPRTLSLCMIVKDEEKSLPGCLESVSPAVDEIVIVDTGSKDRTVEIARSFNARVVRSEWRGDFAGARNLSLENATSSWILWMDADDRVNGKAVANLLRLKREIVNLDAAFGFKVINEKAGGLGDSFLQLRMFPNDPRVRFEKRIHEQVSPSLVRAGYRILYLPEVEIRHTGYFDESQKSAKALRNRAILEEDMANFPDDPNYLSSYGDTFFITGEWEKGIEAYKKVLAIPDCRTKQADIHEFMPVVIALGYKNLKKPAEALEWVEKGLAISPGKAELLFLGAEIAYESGDLDRAMERYLATAAAPEVFSSTPSDFKALKSKARVRIGHIHKAQGRPAEAREWYLRLWEENKNFHDLPADIAETFLAEGNLLEAVRWLHDSMVKFPGGDERAYRIMGEISDKAGKSDDAASFYEKGLSFFPESTALMEKLKELYRKKGDMERYLEVSRKMNKISGIGAQS